LKGIEVMKEAMFKVDRRGTYRFSDRRDDKQTLLLDYGNEDHWTKLASDMVFDHFRGQTVHVENVHDFIILDTPYVYRSRILQNLEKSNPKKIISVSGRKKSSGYPKGCTIQFSP
jgi:hypothetical protein